jgi:hypothetical protein
VKITARTLPTHNPWGEAYWASGLRENLTSRSYGEGLETGRIVVQVPRQSLTRQGFFRTFKQTFGCRKLRSRSARNAQLEVEWALVGLWCVCLLGVRQLSGCDQEPGRLSPAAAIHAFQRTLREYGMRPETHADTLWTQLQLARLDEYPRHASKTSRAYPRKKRRPLIGIPQITLATEQHIAQAAALQSKEDFRLAA